MDTGYIYKNKDGREIMLKRLFKPLSEFIEEMNELKRSLEPNKANVFEIPKNSHSNSGKIQF